MPEPDDIALLRQYTENGSETAFTRLVERWSILRRRLHRSRAIIPFAISVKSATLPVFEWSFIV